MPVGGRLFLFLILFWSSSLLLNIKGEFSNNKERRKRYIFPFLGYLHGYKIGENFALQLPPFVLSPIIIVPVNQQQDINIQKSGTRESFQENGGTFQTNFPVKLTLNSSVENIETNFKVPPANFTLPNDVICINDTFRQIQVDATTSTDKNANTDEFVSTTENFESSEPDIVTTMKPNGTIAAMDGFYPIPLYNNEIINSLQLTTPSVGHNLEQSSLKEDVIFKINNTEVETNEITENKLVEPAASTVITVTTERYPRPNTRYYNPHLYWNNAIVDQFPITTNAYSEEEKELPLPPRNDDRWRRFSSLSKVVLPASGFKPLAGLYYDGFLHKSLAKKTGFLPFDKHYND